MTQSPQSNNAKTSSIINERKLDYLFNVNIKPDNHNSKRAWQNRQQLDRLGFDDDSESRQFIQTHLEQTVQQKNNIVKRFTETFINTNTGENGEIDTEVRDSLLSGKTGKFAQVQSSWEILPDETRRFLSAIIYGK